MKKLFISASPLLYLACIYIAYLVAWLHLGKQPDANHFSVMSVFGGLFYWASLILMLVMLFGIPITLSWGFKQKEWKWSMIFFAGIVFSGLLMSLDPIHAREWFLY